MSIEREFGKQDRRRSLWLYSYGQVKSLSAAHWYRVLILSTIGLVFAVGSLLIGLKGRALHVSMLFDISVLIPLAILASAAIEMPAALAYFYRRYHKFEPTVFEDEEEHDAHNGAPENNHGSDYR